MTQVAVNMKTIDLRKAELQPVAGDDIKTLQALLKSLPHRRRCRRGWQSDPAPGSGRDRRREYQAGAARLPNGGPSRQGRHHRPADLEEAHRAGLLNASDR